MPETVHVVVVGGGYAGVMAANRLAEERDGPGTEITLVDPGEHFTERIRLHEVAAGSRASAGVEWARVLHPGVRRLAARAVRVDAEQQVVLTDADPVPFDWLVLAVGSGELASPLLSVTNPAAALVTRTTIAALAPGSTVTVAGSGPTGIEVACAVATSRPDLAVTVVAPAGVAPRRAVTPAVARRLRRLGIAVADGTVDPLTGDVIAVDGTRTPAARATVWTAGLRVPSLAADSGLPVAADGRLLVDPTLTVPGRERILGAGDAVCVVGAVGAHLRASCASALPLGAHAADTLRARRTGAQPAPIDIGYLARCLDLGAGHGHVQALRPDDTARVWALGGRPGGWAKEQVCRMTVSWLATEARRPGSYSWPSGPRASVG